MSDVRLEDLNLTEEEMATFAEGSRFLFGNSEGETNGTERSNSRDSDDAEENGDDDEDDEETED